ncbi:MAG: helix-turn-helix transcriptional regulator [Acetobacter sp.]|jgi:transcriptional regulator with XRE-family HTH domain
MVAVTMRLDEVGQQLRAFRLESGMRADEIAARLGVSRAALYRYEKGEVIKLDTIQRMAELLKVSPLTLLGIGVEYYSGVISFSERMRHVENDADQILQISDPFSFFVVSSEFVDFVGKVRAGSERFQDAAYARASEQSLRILHERRAAGASRRPALITVLPESAVIRFLREGVCDGYGLSGDLLVESRRIAAREIQRIIQFIENSPIGLQFSFLPEQGRTTPNCVLMRGRDRVMVAINPLRPDCDPDHVSGVAMLTGAPEAVNSHQNAAELLWKTSLKGAEAVTMLQTLLAAWAVE